MSAVSGVTSQRAAYGPAPTKTADTARRVAQVCSTFAPCVGGVERSVAEIAHELSGRGATVEVHTTTIGAGDAPRREWHRSVLVHRHRAMTLCGVTFSLGLFLAVLRMPRTADVHVHVPHAGVAETVALARWLTRSTFVVHHHLDVPASSRAGRLLPLYKRVLLGPCLRSASAVLVLGQEMRNAVAAAYRLDPARVSVVRNGVSASFRDEARSPRTTIGTPGRPARLVFVGRLVTQKNPLLLVESMNRCPVEAEVIVIGDGPLRSDVERRIAQSGQTGRIRLVGGQRAEQVISWLSWADMLVSTSHVEGMPLACLEAFGAGVPVLATDVPGTRDLVAGVGLLARPDAAALAAAIERLVRDDELRRQLVAKGRAAARELTWAASCDDLIEAYDRVRKTS